MSPRNRTRVACVAGECSSKELSQILIRLLGTCTIPLGRVEGGEGLGGVHQGPRGSHATSAHTHVELQKAVPSKRNGKTLEDAHPVVVVVPSDSPHPLRSACIHGVREKKD
jgi:hypothetical protein